MQCEISNKLVLKTRFDGANKSAAPFQGGGRERDQKSRLLSMAVISVSVRPQAVMASSCAPSEK